MSSGVTREDAGLNMFSPEVEVMRLGGWPGWRSRDCGSRLGAMPRGIPEKTRTNRFDVVDFRPSQDNTNKKCGECSSADI